MERDVQDYVKKCPRCVFSKTPEPAARAALESIKTTAPLELVCVDFWSAEDRNNKSVDVLVITDHFKKLAHAFPCQDQAAKRVAKKVWDGFFCVYGFPQRIHSDQGASFESELITELLKLAGIDKSRTTPYHPMENGGTERFNRTLGNMLRSLPPRPKQKWPQLVQTMTFVYNCTAHETTGFAPFYLMFGRVPRLPVDLMFQSVLRDKSVCDYGHYVASLISDLQSAMSVAQKNSVQEQKQQSSQYNKRVKGLPLAIGEDLLRSGGLKAHQIARELGQLRQGLKVWTQNKEWSEESFSQESSSDHALDSISGLSHSFNVIAKLGQAGFGCVYKVKHKYDGKIYAVKRVILTRKADSEVKALARLDHPNIVRYITCWPASDNWMSNQEREQVSNTPGSSSDVVTFERASSGERDDDDDDTSGMESLGMKGSASAAVPSGNNRTDRLDSSNRSRTYLFIQTEFCEGGTLTGWIQASNHMEKHRTTLEIHKVFYEIITGVEYIHANKLIHRDLKPDNILFGADGKVKIGDFGLVAAQTDQKGDPIERSKRKGTPPYMSPEQKNKKNYDEKTDIFPLGLVWFEMIWNISTGSERGKLWPDLRNQRFPEVFSDWYRTECTFIKKMLSYSPEHRPHAKDIKENLLKFFSLGQRAPRSISDKYVK